LPRDHSAADAVVKRVNSVQTFEGRKYMRRGFLYALLAGIIYFFAAGYSGMTIPLPFHLLSTRS